MTFVNERISDADKARIDFSKIMHPIHKRDPINPSKWTIDHERDIALIYLGGGGLERPTYFLLYWQGQVLTIFLTAITIGDYPTKDLEVTWSLDQWMVPDNVTQEQMFTTLKEALFAFGYRSIDSRDEVKAVHFKF